MQKWAWQYSLKNNWEINNENPAYLWPLFTYTLTSHFFLHHNVLYKLSFSVAHCTMANSERDYKNLLQAFKNWENSLAFVIEAFITHQNSFVGVFCCFCVCLFSKLKLCFNCQVKHGISQRMLCMLSFICSL